MKLAPFTGWGSSDDISNYSNPDVAPDNVSLNTSIVIPDDHPRIMWPYQTEHWRNRWFDIVGDDEIPPTTYAALAATLSTCYGSQLRLDDLSDFLMLYSRQEYAVSDSRMFGDIIPFIYKLIKNAAGLPAHVLLPGDNVKISRRDVSAIIAMMLFGMFDYLHMDDTIDMDDIPQITMLDMFKSQNMNAFASIIGYFDTIVESANNYTSEFESTILVYCRVAGTHEDIKELLSADRSQLHPVEFIAPSGVNREIKVCSVEEIPLEDTFTKTTNHTISLYEHTELIVVGAFIPRLDPGESIIVYGADKFNEFSGRTYTGLAGCHYDYGVGSTLMAKIAIILVPPSSSGTTVRVSRDFIPDFHRLRTAFAAVRPVGFPITISPYMIPWTIGVGGNVYSTFLQCWLAASMSGRYLIFPANDCNLRETAARFIAWSKRGARTISALWLQWQTTIDGLLGGKKPLSEVNLFSAIESHRSDRTGKVRFRPERGMNAPERTDGRQPRRPPTTRDNRPHINRPRDTRRDGGRKNSHGVHHTSIAADRIQSYGTSYRGTDPFDGY